MKKPTEEQQKEIDEYMAGIEFGVLDIPREELRRIHQELNEQRELWKLLFYWRAAL